MDAHPSDTLVRAARELLRWDQKMLAEKAGVGVATVRRFETGASVRSEKIDAIVAALRRAGVAFLGPQSRDVDIREGVALTGRTRKRVYRGADAIASDVSENPAGTAQESMPAAPRRKRRG